MEQSQTFLPPILNNSCVSMSGSIGALGAIWSQALSGPVHRVNPNSLPSRDMGAPWWARFMGRKGSGSWTGKCGNDECVRPCIHIYSGWGVRALFEHTTATRRGCVNKTYSKNGTSQQNDAFILGRRKYNLWHIMWVCVCNHLRI